MADGKVSKQKLIEDIQKLAEVSPVGITRNYYRANGKYAEAQWQQ